MARQIPVSYILDEPGSNLFRESNGTHVEKWKKLTPGINIFETDIGDSRFFLKLIDGQEFLSDTVFEENKLYFIRLVGKKHINNMCMINYNPNWNCEICKFANSYKYRCEKCNTLKPKFRSYRKKLGKTKRSKSRSKRSKSIH
jgi:hypothetical protein